MITREYKVEVTVSLRLVVPCPGCDRLVTYPGKTSAGDPKPATCPDCGPFDFDPWDVSVQPVSRRKEPA